MTLSIHYDTVDDMDLHELVNIICYKRLSNIHVYIKSLKDIDKIEVIPTHCRLKCNVPHVTLDRVDDHFVLDYNHSKLYSMSPKSINRRNGYTGFSLRFY